MSGRRERLQAKFWRATCSEWGVRITLKTDIAGPTLEVASVKSSSVSFLDLLAQVSGDALQALKRTGTNAQAQTGNESDQGDSNQAEGSTATTAQEQTGSAKQTGSDSGALTFATELYIGQLKGQTANVAVLASTAQLAGYTKSQSTSTTKSQRDSSSAGQSETEQAGRRQHRQRGPRLPMPFQRWSTRLWPCNRPSI